MSDLDMCDLDMCDLDMCDLDMVHGFDDGFNDVLDEGGPPIEVVSHCIGLKYIINKVPIILP